MIRAFAIPCALFLGVMSAQAQYAPTHPFWKFKARDENRWLLEKILRQKKYWNEHHKKAVKAAEEELWGISLDEYEAAVRALGLSFRKTTDPVDSADIYQAQLAVLEAPELNSIRFELALAYANRADELYSFGRTQEADSLAKLAVYFLEHVHVYALGRRYCGISFSRLAAAFSQLGRHDDAIRYYRTALLYLEQDPYMADPLKAVVNVRLGQEYIIVDRIYDAEPPLLRGAEFADSAAAALPEIAGWCRQLSVEGRAYLAETCRKQDRIAEAESLFAEAMQMALRAEPPMMLHHCRPLFERYATLLRELGNGAEADSVNYRTDLLMQRAESEIERQKKKPR